MNLKTIVNSWDIWVAIGLTVASALLFPRKLEITAVRDFYSLGIAVLSTVFSVFFAALAIIMSSSDDDFIEFLEQEGGGYSKIIATFRFTLMVLFLALVSSVFDYVYTYLRLQAGAKYQQYSLLVSFEFLFLYGLFAALASALDTISYARYRSRFLSARRREKEAAAPTAQLRNMGHHSSPEPVQVAHIDMRSSSEERRRDKKKFDAAFDVRKFEIELFWKRSLFFWGFIAAALVGIATLKNEQPMLSLLISEFGIICSLAWTLANRGSKYWQEQWESKIEQVEDGITGPLFKNEEKPKNFGWWLQGRRYSVSRLATAVSDSVLLLWVSIYIRQLWICLRYGTPAGLSRTTIWAISSPVIPFFVLVLLYGRSTPRDESV
jgi:hypothetical protein